MKLDCVWKYGQYQGNPNNMKSGFLKRKQGTLQGHGTLCLGCNLCLIGKWQKGCRSPGSLYLMGDAMDLGAGDHASCNRKSNFLGGGIA